jgi:hypothetical protein
VDERFAVHDKETDITVRGFREELLGDDVTVA